MPDSPLSGLRVLETGGFTAAYTGKLLAEAGAEVVRLRPEDGDPLATEPPFFGTSTVSIQETWYNLGKRIVALDTGSSAGRGQLRELVARAQVLVEEWDDGRQPLSAAEFEAANPALIRISLRNPAIVNDLVANALSGAASVTGDAHTPPLNGYGNQTHHTVGMYATICALAAVFAARRTGRGVHIDLSSHEALASCTEQMLMQWFFPGGGNYPPIAKRQGSLHWSGAYAVYPDHKGQGMMLTAALRFLDDVLPWLETDGMAGELADRERFPDLIAYAKSMPLVMQRLREWVATKDAEKLFFEAQDKHLSWGPSRDIAGVLSSPQIEARGYLQPRKVPGAGTQNLPMRLFQSDADGPPPPAAVEVSIRDLGWDALTPTKPAGHGNPARPLEGLRVLDFTHVLAGPFGTRALADLGADVIKVNSAIRAGGANSTAHPYYLSWNRSKRSVLLNMTDPRAIDVARRIAEQSDAITENFSAGILKRWGLDRPSMRERNPKLTVVSMGGMGQTGPWRKFVTFAPTIHALVGLTYLTNMPGEHLSGYGFSLTDHLSGLAGAIAVLEGAEHAARTGEGLDIDLSQFELGLGIMAPALIDHIANGVNPEPAGNRHPFGAWTPHGIYPALGEDRWVALGCRGDDDWASLCAVMGRAELAGDPRFASHAWRLANEDALDAAISDWTRGLDRYEVMARCQAAGVAAGAVQNAEDLTSRDEHLRAREFFGLAEPSGEVPGHPVDQFPALFDGARPGLYTAAHPLGSDTFDVLVDLLGMDEGEVAELMAEGVLS